MKKLRVECAENDADSVVFSLEQPNAALMRSFENGSEFADFVMVLNAVKCRRMAEWLTEAADAMTETTDEEDVV